MSKADGSDERTPKKPPGKKPYAPPRLVEYGSVAKLTRGGQSAQADGTNMMNCL